MENAVCFCFLHTLYCQVYIYM